MSWKSEEKRCSIYLLLYPAHGQCNSGSGLLQRRPKLLPRLVCLWQWQVRSCLKATHHEPPGVCRQSVAQLTFTDALAEDRHRDRRSDGSCPRKERTLLLQSVQTNGVAPRTTTLGENPKEVRVRMRLEIAEGYYVSCSGKKSVRTFHQLGSCFRLPNID